MFMISAPARSKLLLKGLLAGILMNLAVFAQSPGNKGQSAPAVATVTQKATGTPTRYQPNRVSKRETAYYESVWGVDLLSVRAVESGELIRFTYQVIDPEKSKSLNDKKLEPALIFPEGHVKLIIPSLEKVGQLRQSSTPEAGKSYWMAFSNPQRTVKRGDRVDVVIGSFRAEGLIVE
jgi:hypothetical protein